MNIFIINGLDSVAGYSSIDRPSEKEVELVDLRLMESPSRFEIFYC